MSGVAPYLSPDGVSRNLQHSGRSTFALNGQRDPHPVPPPHGGRGR